MPKTPPPKTQLPKTQIPKPLLPPAPLKVWIVSGALTLAVVAIVGSIVVRFIPDLNPSPEPIDIDASLEEQVSVIEPESDWLSEIACPAQQRSSFESLKQEGIEARARANYSQARAKLKAAFDLCAAPEVLIALNNARIGNAAAHTLVVSVPFSGSNPNNAVEMLRGFAQAQNEINQQNGIDGVPLKLLVVDDGDREDVASDLAIALTEDPAYANVLGIVGHWTSDVSIQAAPIYASRKALTFITPISTTNELTNYSPWVFRATLNNRDGTRALARYMLNYWRKEKVAIFYVDDVTYSEEIRREFKRVVDPAQGGQIIAEFDMGAQDFNARRAVRQAKESGAEVILLVPDNGSLNEAIAVIKANNKALKVLGDLANLYNSKVLSEAGEAAAGMVMAIPWDIDGNASANFVQTSKQLWKGPVNHVTATSYSALQAMAVAIEERPTRAGVQRALNDPNFAVLRNAANVPLRFDNGNRQARI
ncbi:MAG: ABC transporter substrate-binding protein [Phormidesmis sp.]